MIQPREEHLTNPRVRGPLVKSLNQIKLLNLIQQHGPVSRASLAKLSGLSKPTVSSQVDSLIQQGWVVGCGQGESGTQGGKKPTLVQFNADSGRLVAVEINPQTVRLALADLNGVLLNRLALPTPEDRSAAQVLPVVKSLIRQALGAENGSRPLGCVLTVAAPGRVDTDRGVVLEADQFAWRSVPVGAELEAAFGWPVFVDNNVKMAAMGEKLHGAAADEKNFVVVRLDNGVASGIFIDGRLYHGSQWGAGEIAHMVLDPLHAEEDWGPRGFLEGMVGSDRFELQVRALTGRHSSALEALEAGRQDGGPLRRLYEQFAHYMGTAIANLVCAFDPSLIVLQGPLFEPILEEVNRIVTRALPWRPRVCLSAIHDEAVLLGTVVAARTHAHAQIGQRMSGHAHGEPGETFNL